MAGRPTITDDEILRRARSVFVERGYGARTRQIAAAVGLTWGAIVLRFSDKRELFMRAMARPDPKSCEQFSQEGAADLSDLLERLRSRLWEQWPLRLQYRLAVPEADHDSEPDGIVEALAAALEAHARGGAVRSDMSAKALAHVVLALLVGEVAQRFMARERGLAGDGTFVERVMFLLSPCST